MTFYSPSVSSSCYWKSACCSGRLTGVSGKRKQHLSLGSFSDAYTQTHTHAHTHTQSTQEKLRCLCSCLWNDKEYRKIPNMYCMKQVPRSPATQRTTHEVPASKTWAESGLCKVQIHNLFPTYSWADARAGFVPFCFSSLKNSVLRGRK